MASIVRRKDGRAEIRESYSTPNGPRSRTLAIFRELTDADLDKAARRAMRCFDRGKLLERARALGVPRFGDSASRAARALLAELQLARPLAPSLATALKNALIGLPSSNGVRWDMLRWFGASDVERGEALRESIRGGVSAVHSATNPLRVFRLPALPPIGAPTEQAGELALARQPSIEKPPPSDEKLAELGRGLSRARIPHAWGDAVASSYYAGPLIPSLLELHVFLRADAAAAVLAELERHGTDLSSARGPREPGRGVWVRCDPFLIALRLLEDPHQEVCRRRAREVPFGEDTLWILSAEDLLIRTVGCATSWPNRVPRFSPTREQPYRLARATTSWTDIVKDVMFSRAGELDIGDVRRWLELVLPATDAPRRREFEKIVDEILGNGRLEEGARA